VIEWSPDTATFISNSLSPAKPSSVTLNESEKVATVIVPTEQMSLAIGKEGQNARLAFKLTGWRIDIKDPEAMRDQGLEMFRQVQSQIIEAPEDFGWHGRQPRLVRADGMVSVRDREFGPLDPSLVNMSVDVEVRGEALEVYYNRELRARYSMADGSQLPLDEVALSVDE
jgi:N utilization substance protein A